MTMKNIDSVGQARAQAQAVAGDVRRRAREVREVLEALDNEQDQAEIVHRAIRQAIDEDRGVAAEEGERLARVLGATPPQAPRPPAPAPRPTVTEELPAPAPAPQQPAQPGALDLRTWSGLCWLLAFAGLTVTLLVGVNTRGFHSLPGLLGVLFELAWVLSVSGVGFFGGGLLGSLIERRRMQQPQAPRPAAPANQPAPPAPTT